MCIEALCKHHNVQLQFPWNGIQECKVVGGPLPQWNPAVWIRDYIYCQTMSVQHRIQKCLVAVCRVNLGTGSIGSFTAIAESMQLNVDSIWADWTFLVILICDSLGIVWSSWFHFCCNWEGSGSSHYILPCQSFSRNILWGMRAELSSQRRSYVNPVVASTVRFVLAVKFIICTSVVLFNLQLISCRIP